MKYTLAKPITAHGEEVTELELREPSVKDVKELGYPFSATPNARGEADIKLHPEVGAKYIVRLAGIPMPSVEQIAPGDFMMIHTLITGFFEPTSQGN